MECNTSGIPDSNIKKIPKFIIMLLMGLPGSGKTTLCHTMPYILGNKYHILHVCFDHVVQFREDWSDAGSYGKWKSERAKLLLAVEELIKGFMFDKGAVTSNETDSDRSAAKDSESTSLQQCSLRSKSFQDVDSEVISKKKFASYSNLSEEVEKAIHSQNRAELDSGVVTGVQVSALDVKNKSSVDDLHGKYTLITDTFLQDHNFIYKGNLHDKIILLCVDDNFYYHSMRKEWWNLAARYELAFCTLVVSCEVETCIERVKKRESLYSHPDTVHVPIDVIKRMSKILELPDDKLYHWEKYWSVIETNDLQLTFCQTYSSRQNFVFDETSMQIFDTINKLLTLSLLDPAKPLLLDMKSECFVATPSIIHEMDLALRKIVGRSDKSQKAIVNKRRKGILEDLKNGKLCIPKELTNEEASDKEMLEKYVFRLIDLEEINL